MKILAKAILSGLLVLGTPFQTKDDANIIIRPTEIVLFSPLDFERMYGLSFKYGSKEEQETLSEFITERKLLEGIDEAVETEKDSLIALVQKYTSHKKRFRKKEYREAIFPLFEELNKRITEKKEALSVYAMQKFEDENYFSAKGRSQNIESDKETVISKYKGLVDLLKKLESVYPEDNYYNTVASTIMNVTDIIPLIKELHTNLDQNAILTIISNESKGYAYVVGPSKDINRFQLHPKTVANLYLRLKWSRKEEDKVYKDALNIKNITSKELNEQVKVNKYDNAILGMYYIKEIAKESKNESHFVMLYHIGAVKFAGLPWNLQRKILSGKINSKEDISPQEMKYEGMKYLELYYKRKPYFDKVDNALAKISRGEKIDLVI